MERDLGIHPTLCTLYHTPYTLHHTPYTLHPTQVRLTGFQSDTSLLADLGGVSATVTAVTPDGASSSSGITVVVTLEGP